VEMVGNNITITCSYDFLEDIRKTTIVKYFLD